MRKLLASLTLSIVLGTGSLYAQTDKGTLLLGGNATFQAADDITVFVLNSNLGVFIVNKFAVGMQMSILASEGNSQWPPVFRR